MAVSKGLLTVIGFVASQGLRELYRRALPTGASLPRVLAVTLGASYAAAVLWTAASHWALDAFGDTLLARLTGEPWRTTRPAPLLDGAVYHALALLAWSVLYVGIRYYAELQQERERALRAESLLRGAQLQALRYQLNPHFLFNALNTVSTLVLERRTHEAATMLARVGDFLRLTLASDERADVPLADELEFITQYLAIEQVRFADRLRVDVDATEDSRHGLVPALLLQPLIENAVRHAIAPRAGGGRVVVTARRAGGALVVSVVDDGPGLAAVGAAGGGGIGLSNTRDRLRQRYGPGEWLTLSEAAGGGLAVTVRVPWCVQGAS